MKDAEIISLLRNENDEYKKLEEEHKKLEHSLEEMNKKKYLTPDEEVEKVLELVTKDQNNSLVVYKLN